MTPPIRIALIGDHDPKVTAHRAIPLALARAATAIEHPVEPMWIRTDALPAEVEPMLAGFHGIWGVPASPYASMDGALRAIRFARESGRPYLGTCGGYQHALIEYARNVLGLADADHAETRPESAMPLIASLSCAMVEESERIRLVAGTRVRAIVGEPELEEHYHCSFGVNPRFVATLERGGLSVAGFGERDEVRVFELPEHPFFILTAFQPERSALAGRDHALIRAFVTAARDRAAPDALQAPGAARERA